MSTFSHLNESVDSDVEPIVPASSEEYEDIYRRVHEWLVEQGISPDDYYSWTQVRATQKNSKNLKMLKKF